MSTVMNPAKAASQELSGLRGELIAPDDAGFDEARKVYNGMIDKRPALIARCKRPDDVAKVVAFARDHDLLLAIRGGGHNGAGLGTCDDGVVIDLSLMNDIQVDPEARTVRVGGGYLGARSTGPPTSTAWPPRAASSRPPAWAVSPSAAASGTSRASTG